nr:hypothetical protein [Tanacetum cinerariifolium]
MPRDAVPKFSKLNAEHYATFAAYPVLYLLSIIRTVDPTTIRIGEKERDEDEPKLLETTIGRVVPLLPVAPDHSSSELEASVDKLFDEGRSGEQADRGDSASGGHGVGVQLVDVIAETDVEDVAPAELQRQKKQKTKVVDAGKPLHPVKKLRGDYGVPGGPVVGGKSQSVVQRLLAGAVQHAEVRGGVMPTLPFVSSSVSTTPEREGGDHTELLVGANLHTLEAPQRFVISSDSSDHSGVNIAEAEIDYVVRTSVPIMTSATTATPTADPAAIAKERLVGSLVFGGDSSFADRSHPISGGLSDRTGSDFLVGGIRTVVDPDSNLQRVYVPQWNVTNGFCMDDGGVCREMVDEFAPSIFLSIRGMEHDQLFTEFNVRAARQISLSTEEAEAAEAVRLRDEAQALKERNTNLKKEKSELEVKVIDLAALVKVKEQEIADFDTVVTSVKLHNDSLADQVHRLETSSSRLQEKVAVYENFMSQLEQFQDEKMKEVNEKFDNLCVDFVDMALHLEEKFYPHLLTTFSRRRVCMKDYLLSVNFPLIAELKANKDASVEVIMNLLRLEDALAEKLGLVESQPHVDQLMVPIHHSLDQRVVGASALSLSLDVSSTEGTSSAAPDTTTALSVTSVSASTIPPIFTDDYEIAHTEGGEDAGADVEAVVDEGVDPFPDVSGAELDVSE